MNAFVLLKILFRDEQGFLGLYILVAWKVSEDILCLSPVLPLSSATC